MIVRETMQGRNWLPVRFVLTARLLSKTHVSAGAFAHTLCGVNICVVPVLCGMRR